jgi:hypothetical protein
MILPTIHTDHIATHADSPSAYKPPKSKTPRTDAALDKDWTILDESLENVAKISKQLEIENGELFMAGYSARFILEELNNEPGMWQLATLTGLPMGVIVSAFENIFAGQSLENADNATPQQNQTF